MKPRNPRRHSPRDTRPISDILFPSRERRVHYFGKYPPRPHALRGSPPNPQQAGRRPPAPPARECADTPWTPPPNVEKRGGGGSFPGYRVPPRILLAFSAQNGLPLHSKAVFAGAIPPAQIHNLSLQAPLAVRWCLFTSKACKCLSRARIRQKRPPPAVECRRKNEFCTQEKRVLYPNSG